MKQKRALQNYTVHMGASLRRIAGFSLDRLWVLMMFYSIVPHLSSSDTRGSLYMTFFISLGAMVVTMLFSLIIAQKGDRLSSNRAFILGAAALCSLGTVSAFFADMSTSGGTLFLGVGAILTGVGSAMLFLGWLEVFSSLRERPVLLELALALAASFVMGFILTVISWVIALGVIILLPLASGYLLGVDGKFARHAGGAADASGAGVDGERGGANVGGAGGAGGERSGGRDGEWGGGQRDNRGGGRGGGQRDNRGGGLSRQTLILFVKALGGAFLLGVLAGFFDVLSGYQTYVVQDIYGIYLFLGGFFAMLIVCLIVIFRKNGDIFAIYRFSILLLCLGCLLTPFMSDNNTYSNAVIFGGYSCFILVLSVVCVNVSKGFNISPVRVVGIGFFALYLGELTGYAIAYAYDAAMIPHFSLVNITLAAVSLLLIAHLFLFTEVDLIRVGIGEVNVVATPDEEKTDEKALVAADNSYARLIEQYGLSPRESDVLPLLLQGRTISRIQETLFISAGTVSTHIRHIYHKAGVNNRQELIDLVQSLSEKGKV
ncbi:MAG: LuxR C-terminal-related transcriptional regulator [Coriobacteriales bacterium]|jgi:DNA-binding CsgD family transcriptional regulator|nr:LuxR C-terminal-related transcriptional regulator [Coriobacteriales bacterium]